MDIEELKKLTTSDWKALKQLVDSERNKPDPERNKRLLAARKELEGYCQNKWKASLAEIFTVSNNEPRKWQHPAEVGVTWSGKGAGPKWVRQLRQKEKAEKAN